MYEAYTKDKVVRGMITFEAIGYDHVLDDELHQLWMYQLPEDAAPCSRFADMVLKCVLHLAGEPENFFLFAPSYFKTTHIIPQQHLRRPSMTAHTSSQ